MEAATKARAAGDRVGALLLYEKAASLAQEEGRRAEIHYMIGLMYADPASEARDLERSRSELLSAAIEAPEGPRATEARVFVSLLDDLIVMRAQLAELKTQTDAARAEVAALKARLDEKEKELAEIKKILLQDKGKP
jgi:sulfate adenylyltransferase subunit 1 (EFTu-like GTPase family)